MKHSHFFVISFFLGLILTTQNSFAGNLEIKIACRAAAMNMGNGNGGTVYYPNGRTLTSLAGKTGSTWYCPNGRTLTSNVGTRGATYNHCNGRTFSSNTGSNGATWYFSNGRTLTSSGPELSTQEMADLACELILDGADE